MKEKIFIGVAWPYASGPLHLGHVAGAYLPADIFARYHRTKGNEVLMVSGSDQHGTPIMLAAEQQGMAPAALADRNHQIFLKSWEKLGISFDLFTSTETANHAAVSQDIFLTLRKKGYIYEDSVLQAYCDKCQRFLPDRYIEGVCPLCKSPGARGDQCEACGKPLNANELLQARCRICGNTPVFKESKHYFLKLSAFQERLAGWAQKQAHWRPNVANTTQRYLHEGLRDRAITRDLEWGIPVPVAGYENKRLYVWFEAVIGYLSAAREWAKNKGEADAWRTFWERGGGAKSYYFIGKDNIPFHTLVWPAMLMGYDENLNLPFDVPANEFLTIEAKKVSTSRHWAIWLPDYLSRYDADPLRYFLSINMPESGDTDFSWREFFRRNNDELVATYGNLVNRVLTFVYKNFNGVVPEPAAIDARGRELEHMASVMLNDVDKLLAECHFKQAALNIMSLAHAANRYLDEKSPWKAIKEDRQGAADSLYVAMSVITQLKTLLYPFLPFSSQKVHEYLGFKGKVEDSGWQRQLLPPGQPLVKPLALFTKLDEKLVEEETARLGEEYKPA
ncbi:MAG: methionine--tRNA ligase [Dehalococcoidales bacterium]|nr:methionine--tRNA ligase [Dehalococcoidales bacterium]